MSSSGKQRRASSSRNFETTFVKNTVALAVLNRLHQWCCQLFWLTIVCVIGVTNANKQKTLQDVRRNIINSQQQRRSRTVTELEMQLLRHLTCPQTAVLRPLRRSSSTKKRHYLSRPPSPQLFDICEADESAE
ncbi:Protein E01G4.3 a [Aphelenchoides avenae]|nr:Protein E01G4.3 a [Aphelenchus avenae]